jgi:hypothetical protein
VRVGQMSFPAALFLALALAGGCQPEQPDRPDRADDPNALKPVGRWLGSTRRTLYERFQDEDPSVRMKAVLRAGRWKDRESMPYLVDRLTDGEAEVRFAAILALRRITDETFGYRYYESAAKREQAVRRWRQWLHGGRPASGPATSPATEPAAHGR